MPLEVTGFDIQIQTRQAERAADKILAMLDRIERQADAVSNINLQFRATTVRQDSINRMRSYADAVLKAADAVATYNAQARNATEISLPLRVEHPSDVRRARSFSDLVDPAAPEPVLPLRRPRPPPEPVELPLPIRGGSGALIETKAEVDALVEATEKVGRVSGDHFDRADQQVSRLGDTLDDVTRNKLAEMSLAAEKAAGSVAKIAGRGLIVLPAEDVLTRPGVEEITRRTPQGFASPLLPHGVPTTTELIEAGVISGASPAHGLKLEPIAPVRPAPSHPIEAQPLDTQAIVQDVRRAAGYYDDMAESAAVLRAGIDDVSSSLGDASAKTGDLIDEMLEAKRAEEQWYRVSEALAATADRLNDIGNQLSKRVTAPLVAAAGIGVRQLVGLDEAATRAGQRFGFTREQVVLLRNEMRNLQTETNVPGAELGAALGEVAKRGLDAADSLEVVRQSARLADAEVGRAATNAVAIAEAYRFYRDAGMEVADVAEVLAQGHRVAGVAIEDMAGALDRLLPTMSRLGVPLSDVVASLALFQRAGLNTAQAAQLLARIVEVTLTPNSARMAQELNRAGLSAESLKKTLQGGGGLLGVLNLVADAYDKNRSAVRRLVAQQGGQQQLHALISAIRDDGAAAASVFDQMAQSQGALNDAMQAGQGTADAWKDLWQSIKDVTLELGEILEPVVVRGFTLVTNVLRAVVDASRQLTPETRAILAWTIVWAAAIGPLIKLVAALVGGFSSLAGVMARLAGAGVPLAAALGATGTIGLAITALIGAIGVGAIAWSRFRTSIEDTGPTADRAARPMSDLGREVETAGTKAGEAANRWGDLAAKITAAQIAVRDLNANAGLNIPEHAALPPEALTPAQAVKERIRLDMQFDVLRADDAISPQMKAQLGAELLKRRQEVEKRINDLVGEGPLRGQLTPEERARVGASREAQADFDTSFDLSEADKAIRQLKERRDAVRNLARAAPGADLPTQSLALQGAVPSVAQERALQQRQLEAEIANAQRQAQDRQGLLELTPEQAAQPDVQQRIGRINSLVRAELEARDKIRQANEDFRERNALIRSTFTPAEQYAAQVDRITDLLGREQIGSRTAARAIQDANEQRFRAAVALREQREAFEDFVRIESAPEGIERGLKKAQVAMEDFSGSIEDVAARAPRSLARELAGSFRDTENALERLRNVALGVFEDIAAAYIESFILAPAIGAIVPDRAASSAAPTETREQSVQGIVAGQALQTLVANTGKTADETGATATATANTAGEVAENVTRTAVVATTTGSTARGVEGSNVVLVEIRELVAKIAEGQPDPTQRDPSDPRQPDPRPDPTDPAQRDKLTRIWEAIQKDAKDTWEWIQARAGDVWDAAGGVWESISGMATKVFGSIGPLLQRGLSGLTGLLGKIPMALGGLPGVSASGEFLRDKLLLPALGGLGSLFGPIGSALGGFFGGLFHGGGVSHRPTAARVISLDQYRSARRFEMGGVAGGQVSPPGTETRPGEIPAILRRDEAVIPMEGGAVPLVAAGGGLAVALPGGRTIPASGPGPIGPLGATGAGALAAPAQVQALRGRQGQHGHAQPAGAAALLASGRLPGAAAAQPQHERPPGLATLRGLFVGRELGAGGAPRAHVPGVTGPAVGLTRPPLSAAGGAGAPGVALASDSLRSTGNVHANILPAFKAGGVSDRPETFVERGAAAFVDAPRHFFGAIVAALPAILGAAKAGGALLGAGALKLGGGLLAGGKLLGGGLLAGGKLLGGGLMSLLGSTQGGGLLGLLGSQGPGGGALGLLKALGGAINPLQLVMMLLQMFQQRDRQRAAAFAMGGVTALGMAAPDLKPGEIPAILHPHEAVIPMRQGRVPITDVGGELRAVLPGGRSIPAEMVDEHAGTAPRPTMPRFQSGGVTGGTASSGSRSSSPRVTLTINNHGEPIRDAETKATVGPDGIDIVAEIGRASAEDVRRSGPGFRALRQRTGIRDQTRLR